MALLGYARVSTRQQSLDIQVEALKKAGVEDFRIFTDKKSGSTDDREGLQRLLQRAEREDVILCCKMDRLGRNTADMIRIIDDCYKNGIAIKSLDDGLDTSGPMGRMVVQILAVVAEAERARIMERTNEGKKAALDKGIIFGRKHHKKRKDVIKLLKERFGATKISRETGVPIATVYRIKKELKEEYSREGF